MDGCMRSDERGRPSVLGSSPRFDPLTSTTLADSVTLAHLHRPRRSRLRTLSATVSALSYHECHPRWISTRRKVSSFRGPEMRTSVMATSEADTLPLRYLSVQSLLAPR